MITNINPERGFCWNKVNPEYVSPSKFNTIINELKEDTELLQFKWVKMNIKYRRIANKWFMYDSEDRKEIRVNRELNVETEQDEEGNTSYVCTVEFHRYVWLKNKVIPVEDSAVDDEKSGMQAYQAIEDKFNEYNNTKTLALESVLSGRKYRAQYTLIKGCVPVQIQFMNVGYKGKIVEGVFKADVSSAFPTQIIRDLPTLHGSITVSGRVEPSEEYPFAFYTKSHHIKTLDGYDSHDLKSWYYREYYKCDDRVKDEDEVTILCPKMSEKYHTALSKAFEDCYNHRKDDSFNKFIMNATIGYFQRNNNPALSFISAIVILRCNIDMIRRCNQLEDEGNTVLFIATDSIAWKGKLSPVAIDEKYLGSFTYEGKNIKFLGYSCKAYQWLNNKGECTTKYSGMKKEESAKLKFGELKYKGDAHERKKYQWNAKDMQFVESALI